MPKAWAFACLGGILLPYIAYLDEFGHIGPYISRSDPLHNDSPVFGLAGVVLPVSEARSFGTWFYQRKCELLDWEIKRAGKHPTVWEKKGAALYTARNIAKYPELRRFTNRFLNRINKSGGFIFYVGVEKMHSKIDSNLRHGVWSEVSSKIDGDTSCTNNIFSSFFRFDIGEFNVELF